MEAHFWFNMKCMGRGASCKSWGHKVSDCMHVDYNIYGDFDHGVMCGGGARWSAAGIAAGTPAVLFTPPGHVYCTLV